MNGSRGWRRGRSSANRRATAAWNSTQLLSSRETEGWSTENLETPHEQGSGLFLPSPEEYHYFTPELSSGLLQPTYAHDFGPLETPPLSPEATEKTMYRALGFARCRRTSSRS